MGDRDNARTTSSLAVMRQTFGPMTVGDLRCDGTVLSLSDILPVRLTAYDITDLVIMLLLIYLDKP